ncbi:hypothetical protein [Acidovorax sp. BLS4]|uniref:hypothetical protein n=1 Tax=Acidovorax sp. BLS4 TaxID=3273430 RepID=UPI0029434E0B|nr:hypothetical protein [Paracidovorax avenae]WOI45069.1 hypothetical protein R1Z03_21510 [Paracidovorax avenae]
MNAIYLNAIDTGRFRQRKNGSTPVNAKVINESLTLQLAVSPMVCHAMPMRIPAWLSQKNHSEV